MTSPLSSSPLLMAVLFNQTSPGWRSQFKGTFLTSPRGDIIKEFQHRNKKRLSKLFRNVPIFNSLEMSPFHVADGPYGFGVFLVLEVIVGMRTGAKPCS